MPKLPDPLPHRQPERPIEPIFLRRWSPRAMTGEPLTERGWPPRYAARRIAWHALDHAWEIEDRLP